MTRFKGQRDTYHFNFIASYYQFFDLSRYDPFSRTLTRIASRCRFSGLDRLAGGKQYRRYNTGAAVFCDRMTA
jgi:hypothetical protein